MSRLFNEEGVLELKSSIEILKQRVLYHKHDEDNFSGIEDELEINEIAMKLMSDES